jgi:hypothetical protein
LPSSLYKYMFTDYTKILEINVHTKMGEQITVDDDYFFANQPFQ